MAGVRVFGFSIQAEIDASIRQGEEEVRGLVPPLSQRKLQRARADGLPVSIGCQADDDLNRLIVAATFRKEPGIDFQTAQSARFDGLDDLTLLRRAASEGRIPAVTTIARFRGTSHRF